MSVRFILASGSPRRRELLELLGLRPEILAGDIDESTQINDPCAVVEYLSRAKAEAVAAQVAPDGRRLLILGADTVVVLDKAILGKPSSAEEVFSMLSSLSGKMHKVYTGVTLLDSEGGSETVTCSSSVFFRNLDEKEIRHYASMDEPYDKAGAYALQGAASVFVEKVDGCYTNIIGLPVPLTVNLLRKHGLSVLGMP